MQAWCEQCSRYQPTVSKGTLCINFGSVHKRTRLNLINNLRSRAVIVYGNQVREIKDAFKILWLELRLKFESRACFLVVGFSPWTREFARIHRHWMCTSLAPNRPRIARTDLGRKLDVHYFVLRATRGLLVDGT